MASTRSTLVLIALLVLVVRLLFFLFYTPEGFEKGSDIDGWLTTATNLVNGHGYSSEGIPTATRGPTVVLFFAAVVWLFGDGAWPIVIAQWLADVGTSIFVFFIAVEVFNNKRVAIISSCLFAFYVPGIFHTLRSYSEPLVTFLLAGFTLSLLRVLRAPTSWRSGLCGALLGLAVMGRPAMQFYPLLVLPLMVWRAGKYWNKALPRVTIFLAAFIVVLMPWIVRNYVVFHAFIPGSTVLGRTLYQSHFALGEPDYLRYRSSEEGGRAILKVLEARFGRVPGIDGLNNSYVKAIGLTEYEADRIAYREGIKSIRAHPGRYVALSLWRFFRLWFNLGFGVTPSKLSYATALTNGVLLALAVAAFLFFRGQWLRPSGPLIMLVVYNSAIYMAVNCLVRYSIPVIPYVIMFAALTISSLLPDRVLPDIPRGEESAN